MSLYSRRAAVLIAAFLCVVALSLAYIDPEPQQPISEMPLADLPVVPPAPLTQHMRDVLHASTGFAAVVSYTDDGFEPATTTVRIGQAVRFINNASSTLWVKARGGKDGVYPGDASSCGQSAFDSCVALPHNDFWEMTFVYAGSWQYANAAEPAEWGIIIVK